MNSTTHTLIVTKILAQSELEQPTGIGLVMLVGFLAGSMVGLLASVLLRAFGAPVEVTKKLRWKKSSGTCHSACRCCEPDVKPKRVGQSGRSNCQQGPCVTKCDARGGDPDKDYCCREDDHDDNNDQICDGRCDGDREVCYKSLPDPDGDLGTDDDLRQECNPRRTRQPGRSSLSL